MILIQTNEKVLHFVLFFFSFSYITSSEVRFRWNLLFFLSLDFCFVSVRLISYVHINQLDRIEWNIKNNLKRRKIRFCTSYKPKNNSIDCKVVTAQRLFFVFFFETWKVFVLRQNERSDPWKRVENGLWNIMKEKKKRNIFFQCLSFDQNLLYCFLSLSLFASFSIEKCFLLKRFLRIILSAILCVCSWKNLLPHFVQTNQQFSFSTNQIIISSS